MTAEQTAVGMAIANRLVRRRVSPRFVHADDMLSDAMLGVTKAVQTYVPSGGCFAAFATVVIRGEINKGSRRRLGSAVKRTVSLTAIIDDNGEPLSLVRDDDGYGEVDDRLSSTPLAVLVERAGLSEREVSFLNRFYFDSASTFVIAKETGKSPSSVDHLRRSTIAKLTKAAA